jgi:hypothetical protein
MITLPSISAPIKLANFLEIPQRIMTNHRQVWTLLNIRDELRMLIKAPKKKKTLF